MPRFSQTSAAKLATCDRRLQDIFNEAVEIVDITILEGHRGEAAQNKEFAEGSSKLRWPKGKHNALPSRAVDAWPYTPEGKLDWTDIVAGGRMMGIIQAIGHRRGIRLRFGFDWDGDFRTAGIDPSEHFRDGPHVELVDP